MAYNREGRLIRLVWKEEKEVRKKISEERKKREEEEETDFRPGMNSNIV